MKIKKQHWNIVRWILSVLLVYGVYTETGIWTAIAIGLILFTVERIWFEMVRLFKLTEFEIKGLYEIDVNYTKQENKS